MLILTRRIDESIDISSEFPCKVEIKILGVKGKIVRLGITAPKQVVVDRSEITQRKAENQETTE